jgi:hypothetical protein
VWGKEIEKRWNLFGWVGWAIRQPKKGREEGVRLINNLSFRVVDDSGIIIYEG